VAIVGGVQGVLGIHQYRYCSHHYYRNRRHRRSASVPLGMENVIDAPASSRIDLVISRFAQAECSSAAGSIDAHRCRRDVDRYCEDVSRRHNDDWAAEEPAPAPHQQIVADGIWEVNRNVGNGWAQHLKQIESASPVTCQCQAKDQVRISVCTLHLVRAEDEAWGQRLVIQASAVGPS
jgi:hypothetical protein